MEYSPDNNPLDNDKDALSDSEEFSDDKKSDKNENSKKKKKSRNRSTWFSEESDKTETAKAVKSKSDSVLEDKKPLTKEDMFVFSSKQEEESEPELPENPEDISEEEAILVTKQLVESRENALNSEISEVVPNSSEELEVLANALFIDKLSEHVDEGGDISDAQLDDMMADTAVELDITGETGHLDSEDIEYDVVKEAESIDNIAAESDEAQPSDRGQKIAEDTIEVGPGPNIEDENPAPVVSYMNVPSGGGGNGAGSGGRVPPVAPGVPGAFGFIPRTSADSPSIPPIESVTPRSIDNSKYRRGADLLVGGIVGYLIGRRRGRIKTENRLIPIKKSLEKKVKNLDEKISIREAKIRTLVAEKVAREGEDAKRVIENKIEAKVRAKQMQTTGKVEVQVGSDENYSKEYASSNTIEKRQRQPERLASLILSRGKIVETRVETRKSPKELVRTMPEVQVLRLAEKIVVDGQNAKKLFEQGRIGKTDLREVVEASMLSEIGAKRLLLERIGPNPDLITDAVQNEKRELWSSTGTGITKTNKANVLQNPIQNDRKIDAGFKTDTEISAAADALIATQITRDNKEPSHAIAWTVTVVMCVLLVVLFFLF